MKNLPLVLLLLAATVNAPAAPAAKTDLKTDAKTEVVSVDALLKKPAGLFLPTPVYPAGLKKNGVSGSAVVEFLISTTGAISDIKLIEASDPAFGDAAKEAVARAKFSPGIGQDGQPVNVRLQVPFKFDPKKK